jgi:hypothetical protein
MFGGAMYQALIFHVDYYPANKIIEFISANPAYEPAIQVFNLKK